MYDKNDSCGNVKLNRTQPWHLQPFL